MFFYIFYLYFLYWNLYSTVLCHPPEWSQYKSFSDSRIMATAALWKRRKKKGGKEGKGKIFFLNLSFLKSPRTSNCPVLSPDFPDLASSQASATDHHRGEHTPQPPEYYLSSKSNIHFIVPWNPTTAVFFQVDKNNYWQAGWSGMWWGYENIYRANPALPSPLRGQSQSHLSKTTSNNTSKEYHNCRISRVFQIL